MVSKPLITFAGVSSVVSADYTLSAGITPGVATFYVDPSASVPRMGPIRVEDVGTVAIIPDCIVDKIEHVTRPTGSVNRITVLDRRWRWREFGAISGRYNQDFFKYDSFKKPATALRAAGFVNLWELAALCMIEMGERNFDVRALPKLQYPAVDWDVANPAEALAKLCDAYACRPTLSLNGTVVIVRDGEGRTFNDRQVVDGAVEVDPPESPDEIVVVGGRSLYQHDFNLHPIALENDGTIVNLDDVSYRPTIDGVQTWDYCDYEQFTSVDPEFREAAKRSVFRWYRITTPFPLSGSTEVIESLDRILPILPGQIEFATSFGEDRPKPAIVFGMFVSGSSDSGEPFVEEVDRNVKKKPLQKYDGSFSLDVAEGIVRFSSPVYLLEDIPGVIGKAIKGARIRLRTSFHVRDKSSGGWIRNTYQLDRRTAPKKGATFYGVVDELVRFQYLDFDPVETVVDNREELKPWARLRFLAEVGKYQVETSGSVTLPGFQRYDVDGVIRQVSFILGEDGHGTTRVSVNKEEPFISPVYAERRLFEKVAEAQKREENAEKLKERLNLERGFGG